MEVSFVLLLAVSDSVDEELLGVYRAGRLLGLLRFVQSFDETVALLTVHDDFGGISRWTEEFLDGDCGWSNLKINVKVLENHLL